MPKGIAYTDGENILIADTPNEFVRAFERVNTDDALYHKLKTNARKLIENQYSNQSVVDRLLDFYKQL